MSDVVNPQTLPFRLLPEGCVAHIISLTSPKDACWVAAVSRGFKSAADSDTVWDRFLPPKIVSRASSPLAFSSKKELFLSLRDSALLLDGGKLVSLFSFPFYFYCVFSVLLLELCCLSLTKSGENWYLMSAKALQIGGIDNPQHWEWTSHSESSFAEVAKLRSIDRLVIRGVMPSRMLSPNTRYFAWLKYVFTVVDDGLDVPSKSSIKFVKKDGTVTEGETNTVYLVEPRNRGHDGRISWALYDGWYGIELGEFVIGEGDNFDIHFEVSETERLNKKKGLIIEGIEISPIQRCEKLQLDAFVTKFLGCCTSEEGLNT
ncbi:hypothetical protein C2S51_021143 [Perilla frutescens var. frutescens]|nr:hypothetical protein C2S51_021143 [Perilla frutescens var. frutescens]